MDYYLLEDSDSDSERYDINTCWYDDHVIPEHVTAPTDDFTPVRKKSKKEVVPPVKSTSIAAVPSTTKRWE